MTGDRWFADSPLEVAVTSELVSETTVSGLGVRMGVERPVNYLLKEKAGSTMLELKTFLTRSFKPLNYSHNFSGLVL